MIWLRTPFAVGHDSCGYELLPPDEGGTEEAGECARIFMFMMGLRRCIVALRVMMHDDRQRCEPALLSVLRICASPVSVAMHYLSLLHTRY